MSSIKGIDISTNNGEIDFSKVVNDGVEYVYVQATEGTTFQVPLWMVFIMNVKTMV
jgi:GH25 family lysozyme M1 (1,4-beta-N-acetylmuramidase)